MYWLKVWLAGLIDATKMTLIASTVYFADQYFLAKFTLCLVVNTLDRLRGWGRQITTTYEVTSFSVIDADEIMKGNGTCLPTFGLDALVNNGGWCVLCVNVYNNYACVY